jgi:hypothetical protein
MLSLRFTRDLQEELDIKTNCIYCNLMNMCILIYGLTTLYKENTVCRV